MSDLVAVVALQLRHAIRSLGRNRALTVLIVSILSVGIGVTTASVALFDALTVRPLPFARPHELVLIDEIEIPWASSGMPLQARRPTYRDIEALNETFTASGAYAVGELNLGGVDHPARVSVGLVTPSLFRLLGTVPVKGRLFDHAEGQSVSRALILSKRFWQGRLGGDETLLGDVLSLNGHPHHVVGIVDAAHALPADVDLWIPLAVPFVFAGAASEAITTTLQEKVVARLAAVTSPTQAELRVRDLFGQYGAAVELDRSQGSLVKPLLAQLTQARRPIAAFLLAMSVLLLTAATANVVHLLFARARSRRTELSVRAALGATPMQVMGATLAESACLTVLGAIVGLAVAVGTLRVFSIVLPQDLLILTPPAIDGRILLVMTLLVTIVSAATGLILASDVNRLTSSLRARAHALPGVLVIVEVALAVVLVVGSVLLLRSFVATLGGNTHRGYANVVRAEVSLPRGHYSDAARRRLFFDQLLAEVAESPGVHSAALIDVLPFRKGRPTPRPCFKPAISEGDRVCVEHYSVSEEYFAVVGLRLLAGRFFSAHHDANSQEAVINAALAYRGWPEGNAVGQAIQLSGRPGARSTYTIVGVVEDVRTRTLEARPHPQLYVPFGATSGATAAIVARGSGQQQVSSLIRSAIRRVDPALPVFNEGTMSELVLSSATERRQRAMLAFMLSIIAAGLAGLGVYALIDFGARQRARDIGVRMALGATRPRAVAEMMWEGLRLVAVGVAIGTSISLVLARFAHSLLYGVSPTDILTYAAVSVAFLFLGAIGAAVPAVRATRLSPADVIRMT